MYENLLEGFSSYLALEKNLSINTKLSYVRDVKKFLDYCDKNNINFAVIKPSDLENYLFHLKQNGYKINSIFRKTQSIKAFYKYLLIDSRITENPLSSFRSPRPDRKLPEFLSIEDIERILSVFNGDRFNNIRTFAIIELLYSTGMRVSELTNLVLESINLTQLWIRVIGKGNKERIIPINENAANILKIYLYERDLHFSNRQVQSYLFLNKSGKKISRIQIWKDIKKISKKAQISKNIYPHLFRHTFATHLLNGGADLKSISEMLGHSSLSTTQIYTHLDNKTIKSLHRKYHPRG